MDSPHQVVGVLTRPPAKKGRGRKLVDSPVASRAREAGIPVFTPRTLRDQTQRPDFSAFKADVAVVVAYGLIIPADLLEVFPHGWVNLHYSLLPKYRGASPVEHALLAGETTTGVSLFRIEQGLDTGPIFASAECKIGPETTGEQLLGQLTELGCNLLPEVLSALEDGSALAVEQAESTPSYAGMITKADARVDWGKSAEEIERMIRAFTTSPGAWTMLPDGKRITLGPVRIEEQSVLSPAEVRVEKHGVWVGSATRDLKLKQVTPAGKKPMPAQDWGRGLRCGPSFYFEKSLDAEKGNK